jgi:hypothetical protein
MASVAAPLEYLWQQQGGASPAAPTGLGLHTPEPVWNQQQQQQQQHVPVDEWQGVALNSQRLIATAANICMPQRDR